MKRSHLLIGLFWLFACFGLMLLLAACTPTALLPTPTVAPPSPPLPSEAPSPLPTPTPVSLPPSLGKVAYIQGGDIWVKALPEGQPQRLTTGGQNREPRWSPSGEWLAFRKGEEQVWVMRADGSAAHVVHDGAAITAFAWAPTQDRLAYATGDGALMVVDADGANQQELVGADVGQPYTGVVRFAWSPDGAWLAYEYIAMRQEGERAGRNAGLWRIRADGSDAAELLNAGTETYEPLLAGWAADGSALLYWVDPMYSRSLLADGGELMILPIAGGGPIQPGMTTLAYADFVVPGPAGSDLVAVIAGGYRGAWTGKRLHLLSVRTGKYRALTPADVAASSPAWSPDGRQIAYIAMPDKGDLGGGNEAKAGLMQRRLFVVNALGEARPRQLTDDPAYGDEAPLWLNGNQILFVRVDAQDRASLWLVPAAGGDPRRMVDELSQEPGGSKYYGDWQTTIIPYYGHMDWSALFDMWWQRPIMEQVPPTAVPVTPTPGSPTAMASPPCLEPVQAPPPATPAGRLRVIYAVLNERLRNRGNLWLWNEETQTATRLPVPEDAADAHASSDGRLIAFQRILNEQESEIWVMNADGSNPRRLAIVSAAEIRRRYPDATGIEVTFSWLPNTHTLAYTSRPLFGALGPVPHEAVYLVDAETGRVRQVIPPGEVNAFVYAPNASQIAALTARELRLIDARDGHVQFRVPLPLYNSPDQSMAYSPDGRYLAVFTTEGIAIVNPSNGDWRSLPFEYRRIGMGEFYATPGIVWLQDAPAFYTAIANEEDVFAPEATFTVWRVDGATATAKPLHTFTGSVVSAAFSPDRRRLAFWTDQQGHRKLYLANISDGRAVLYDQGRLNFHGWAPDSIHFIYWWQGFKLGHICESPRPLNMPPGEGDITWLDTGRFLALIRISGERWSLRLQTVGGEGSVIATMRGYMVSYSVYFEE